MMELDLYYMHSGLETLDYVPNAFMMCHYRCYVGSGPHLKHAKDLIISPSYTHIESHPPCPDVILQLTRHAFIVLALGLQIKHCDCTYKCQIKRNIHRINHIAVMSIILLPWFLCVLLVLFAHSGSEANKDIFILAGQSNMAGRGGVNGGKWDGNVPPECKPNPSILRFNAQLQWEKAREPLHADIDVGRTCGIGPGLAFANELIRTRPWTVGLVPCAVGGTRIGQWSKGSRLYNELVRRSAHSVSDGGGRIRALVWYQGESDTVRKEDAEAYKHKMETFITDLRSDLQLPSLLIIQVAIASGEGKFVEKVREAQLGIKLPNVKCVDGKGLHLKADKLHLTTVSEVHLGIRLAHAYLASAAPHLFNHTLLPS